MRLRHDECLLGTDFIATHVKSAEVVQDQLVPRDEYGGHRVQMTRVTVATPASSHLSACASSVSRTSACRGRRGRVGAFSASCSFWRCSSQNDLGWYTLYSAQNDPRKFRDLVSLHPCFGPLLLIKCSAICVVGHGIARRRHAEDQQERAEADGDVDATPSAPPPLTPSPHPNPERR